MLDIVHFLLHRLSDLVTLDCATDFGLGWVLVGHSERRHLMGETLDMTVEKVLAAFSVGLKVVLCIGETLAEREADKVRSMRGFVVPIPTGSPVVALSDDGGGD